MLIRNPEGIFGREISEELGVSTRTLRNEIPKINQILEELGMPNCIRSSNKRGYTINISYKEKLKELIWKNNVDDDGSNFQDQDPEDRMYKMIGQILFNGGQSYYDLAEIFYVSEPTIIRDMKKLESQLSKYGIKKMGLSNGIFDIDESESKIRYLLFKIINEQILRDHHYYLQNTKHLLNNNFDLREYHLLKTRMKDYLDTNRLKVDDKSLEIIVLSIYIVKIRNRFGHELKEECGSLDNMTNTYITSMIYELDDHELGKKDIKCLREFLWSIKISHQKGEIIDNNVGTSTSLILGEFCERVFKKYKINLRESEDTFNYLETHIEYMVRRIDTKFELVNPTMEGIKKRYSFAYEVAMLVVPIIYKYKKVYLSDDEISYIALYVEYFLEKHNYGLEVIIINDTGTGIVDRIVQDWIQSNFPNEIKIVRCLSKFSLNDFLDKHKVDLIISTSIVPMKHDIPVFILERIPGKSDYVSLHNYINNLKMKKSYNRIMTKTLAIDHIFIYKKPVQFKDVISDMSDKLEQRDRIYNYNDFINDVLQREKNYPTVIGNQLMIPHPLTTFAKRTTVSVALLKDSLCHTEGKVKLIFLLAVENKMDDDVGALFHFLQLLATEEKVFSDLARAKDKRELLGKIKQLPNLLSNKIEP